MLTDEVVTQKPAEEAALMAPYGGTRGCKLITLGLNCPSPRKRAPWPWGSVTPTPIQGSEQLRVLQAAAGVCQLDSTWSFEAEFA